MNKGMNGKPVQGKSSHSPACAGGLGQWQEAACAVAAAVLSPCPDHNQPCGSHFGGKTCLGTCISKTPRQSLQLLGLVWTVAMQTREAWLGSCPRASDRLGSDLPKVLLLPLTSSAKGVKGSDSGKHMYAVLYRRTGSHKVRAGWSLADLKTNLFSAGNAGVSRRMDSGVWQIQPPSAVWLWRSIWKDSIWKALLFSGTKWK